MSMNTLMNKVIDTMSVGQLAALRDGWRRRLEAANAEGNEQAAMACERLIGLYQERIDARLEGRQIDSASQF